MMEDDFFNQFFNKLQEEIDNEDYIKELEETIEDKKIPLEPLVKKYY